MIFFINIHNYHKYKHILIFPNNLYYIHLYNNIDHYIVLTNL
jgi:hypothetical protein